MKFSCNGQKPITCYDRVGCFSGMCIFVCVCLLDKTRKGRCQVLHLGGLTDGLDHIPCNHSLCILSLVLCSMCGDARSGDPKLCGDVFHFIFMNLVLEVMGSCMGKTLYELLLLCPEICLNITRLLVSQF